MRKPLIDGDVIRYEIGFASEVGWQQEGVPPFDYVADKVDNLINHLCVVTESTLPPVIYFTGKTNFRTDIAKRQKYKDRLSNKPYHYKNITAYLKGKYEWKEREGFEADDLMSIDQVEDIHGTIICTRDKDLHTTPGWVYGWELGNQASFGPDFCDTYGHISLSEDRKKIRGRCDKFFYTQCLTGDPTDTIPGLPRCGPVKAFSIVEATTTPVEGYQAVLEAYRATYGDTAEKELLEQARLLWMVKSLNEDGSPKMWEPPNV